jgi:hypothetical protein
MHPVRHRRLLSDLAAVQRFAAASEGRIVLQSAIGDPPESYVFIFRCRSLCLGTWKPHEKLDSLVQRIGSILCYDPTAINWRSVADDEAAAWARTHQHLFPLDHPFPSAATLTCAHV